MDTFISYFLKKRTRRLGKMLLSQLEAQSMSKYHAKLLSAMDLERNQIKVSFSHSSSLKVSFAAGFKTMNLTIDEKYIPLPEKIKLHRKTRELIYNDLSKTSLVVRKEEDL